ncbi:hypothetical protein HXX76_002509 [Chlamydomonas incerta]|uniref:Uncharacterized protein n=1 Tax=Chlamydomonas incerta TaxID=51695 RepID=A0A835W916_CHLIN|nr:hypothetical protein HXX76_002509 [Chlamydomonas incerta]|eukprot:KAG2442423.1 hypothetical protein HXX76_002509 [Chlamydomonas incerta]
MSLWGYIIANTSSSPARLLGFGAMLMAGTFVVGSMFSSAMSTGPLDAKQQKILSDQMSYDNKRLASAQQQRLSNMLREVGEGRGDDHWSAAMRGTLKPHPQAENKTEGLDKERLAKALAAAKQ